MAPDHYAVLGVAPDARHAEIRTAYRSLMRANHPDLRPGDPSAEELSRRLTAAWAVLGKPSRRAAYDRTRQAAQPRMPMPARGDDASVAAYSPAGSDYRRAFHLASLKVAVAVFALGLVLLLTLTR